MRKVLHIAVISVFTLAGSSYVLEGLGSAWHLRTITGPYFRSELDILGGIAFLLAAAGLFRFEPRVRVFAIFLAGLSLVTTGIALIIVPGIVVVLWLVVWLLVLLWLLSSPVRAQFVARMNLQKTA